MHCHALLNWLGSGASSGLPSAAGISVVRMSSSIPVGWLCANYNNTLVWAERTVNVKLNISIMGHIELGFVVCFMAMARKNNVNQHQRAEGD